MTTQTTDIMDLLGDAADEATETRFFDVVGDMADMYYSGQPFEAVREAAQDLI